MSVIALVPAKDEAERIAATVTALRGLPSVDRILVIDDGSLDATAARARAAGAEVLPLGENRGKGGALQAGIDLLTAEDGRSASTETDVLLFLDADLGASAAQADALLRPILNHEADMTIACLPKLPGSGGFGLVKGLARTGIRLLAGFTAQAPLSGQRALSRRAWTAALPIAPGFGVEVALTVRVARAGLRVLEVPTTMSHAATGKDPAGFAHRGRQFVAVARTLGALVITPRRQSGSVADNCGK